MPDVLNDKSGQLKRGREGETQDPLKSAGIFYVCLILYHVRRAVGGLVVSWNIISHYREKKK